MGHNWWELQILCEPNLQDTIFWRLEKFGCRGTASENKGNSCMIRAYLLQNQVQVLDLAALSLWLRQDALIAGLSAPQMQWKVIDQEDWANSWKEHWHPLEIGDRFLINPAWLPTPEQTDRILLRLDPGVAFGTGNHTTTQLCLEALEMRVDQDSQDAVIADIGCGSGILAIGAILLGAGKVYAVDTDPLAVESTCLNRDLNQIQPERIVVEQGSVETVLKLTQAPVDGIVCNILAEVILELIPQMNAIAKSTTWGILSGILADKIKNVADSLEANGWIIAAIWRRQEWCCFNIRRV